MSAENSLFKWINESSKNEYVSRKQVAKSLVKKWEQTGLLEGIKDKDSQLVKTNIACLLENQLNSTRKQLLAETSALASGDVQGFATVAFPMIRRVFADIISNELVSVQPMSMPNGLIFFLDFQAPTAKGVGAATNASVYGGGVVGSQITGGLNLTGVDPNSARPVLNLESGFYSLNFGYGSPTGSATQILTLILSGVVGAGDATNPGQADLDKAVNYDIDLSGSQVGIFTAPLSTFSQLNQRGFVTLTDQKDSGNGLQTQVRRLTSFSGSSTSVLRLAYVLTGAITPGAATLADMTSSARTFKWAIVDDFQNVGSSALGAVVGDPTWGFEFGGNIGENSQIPEIDIKIDSVSITTLTKKLKARWTPELAQDLDAYQNMDAEVELTSVITELVGLEIDAEILTDLVQNAYTNGAATRYWSALPGKFLDKRTGATLPAALQGDFTGNVSEWYMTLLMTINEVSAEIHRHCVRGGATFLVTSPNVCAVLESTSLWYADISADDDKGGAGTMKMGKFGPSKWKVYSTPYFGRNTILVGRKGTQTLETGYIYAPYVPLQTTPAIPDPDTFVLNKGIMTRYGKKLVNPKLYGLVFCRDLV